MISRHNQFLGELDGNPAGGLNTLGALIDYQKVKKIVLKLMVDVTHQSLVGGTSKSRTDDVCVFEDRINMLLLYLTHVFF